MTIPFTPDCPGTCTCGHPTACTKRTGLPEIEPLTVITAEELLAIERLCLWVDAYEDFVPRTVRDAVKVLDRLRPSREGRITR